MSRLSLLLVGVIALLPESIHAQDNFLERFALATNREEVLKELIPGTQDYYYYHCLHYQNTRQLDLVDEMLEKWIARHKSGDLLNEILYRQSLLTYGRTPQKTLDFIRQKQGLQFNHQRDTPDARPELPTSLNPNLISFDTLKARAMNSHRDLGGFEDTALRWLVKENLDPGRRRHLLSRLQRPDVSRLPEMVVADLRYPKSGGFGSLAIHSRLLLEQLERCAELMPGLLANSKFVNAWVARLRPDNDTDMRFSREARDAYLTRLQNFVSKLPPNQNSLKAHVLYQRLRFDREQGRYDKATFLDYIRLPRRMAYMDTDYMKRESSRRYPSDLNADFQAVTTMQRVGNDEPLVRDYLLNLLAHAENTSEFDPYLNDTWLRYVFAEAKIVNGVGDAEKWYSLLPPDRYRALRDRIDIDFAHTNRDYYNPDDAVSLDVFVKNVPTLIIKVFEINAANFYRDYNREVNTDINLDGLVASREETVEYKEPPLRRVRRHFEFPELNRRGTYVVDFIGNGKASRALIRKGRLHFVTETIAGGQQFLVFDEANRHLKDAELLIGEQHYKADDEGRIVVPFSTQPGRKPVVVRNGSFVSLGHFNHLGEAYEFRAAMQVDRESLIRGSDAKLIVRPQLSLGGSPVSLSVLTDVRLQIRSVDSDGINTSQTVEDFKLHEDRESVHEFAVPSRLAAIGFTLTAKVENVSQGKDTDVSASHTFMVNGIDKTHLTADAHLGRVDGQFVIDVLGRTGEAREAVPVRVTLKHADFKTPVTTMLRSDATGRIPLGRLEGIERVQVRLNQGRQRSWSTTSSGHQALNMVHAAAGQPVRIRTLVSELTPQAVSVLELRGNEFVANRYSSAKLRDGFLVLDDLSAGDYRLTLLENQKERQVLVRITDGVVRDHYVLGDARKLKTDRLGELQISELKVDEKAVRVQLAQSSQFARVHVFANTFRPEHSPMRLATGRPGLVMWTQAPARSRFVEGRNIGDEYRYILDRRYLERYPGNMNPRPGILLNPWPVRTTQTEIQDAQKGGNFAPAPADAAAVMDAQSRAEGRRGGSATAQGPNLDFLSDAALVLTNLTPDENGVVTINLDALEGHQEIHVVAVDPLTTVWKSHSLPKRDGRSVDLRLARGFDPEKDFSQQKEITTILPGETFRLEDATTSQLVMYDSLRGVFQLLETLNGDENLKKFRFVLDWPTLEPEQKRSLYSEHACHELNYLLFRKDPEFFATVIRPYLANKYHKTFLDEWLLGMDVSRFTQPWHYSGLNTFERILLAQRLADERGAGKRYINDQFDVLPPDTRGNEQLFATALSISALSAGRNKDAGSGGGMGGGGFGRGFQGPVAGAAVDAEGATDDFSREALMELQEKAADKKAVELRSRRKGLQSKRYRAALGKRALQRGGEVADRFYALGDRGRSQLFRQLDKTQEWAENNYYRLPIEAQDAELVQVDGFWKDYANHEGDGPFVSPHVAQAAGNFTEMLLALAVLDLPFESAEHKKETKDSQVTLTAAGPGIIVHEQIRLAKAAENKPPVLVGQNIFRLDDRYRIENNQKVDKFVTDEFLIHTVYGAQVVVTNPTSTPRVLSALLQIPVGALPVGGSKYTTSKTLMLGPYATQTIEYLFYFPVDGDYPHYPVHVARDGELVAETEAFRFNVVKEPSSIDQKSWEYVSQYASADDVLKYLREHNLNRIDVGRIAWRMKTKSFFEKVLALLDERHHYNDTLWSYAVHHNDAPRISQYLRAADAFVATCGLALDSPLLTIDPVERGFYQHLEYRPLVNARAHQLGPQRKILNDRFREQYGELMSVLTQKAELSDRDLLAVSYYMLLQDRIGDALSFFGRVNPENLPSRLQHDYFAAYTDFYTKGLETAKAVVARYADYPIDHWREVFAGMSRQIQEIDTGSSPKDPDSADPKNRDETIAQLARADCSLDVALDSTEVKVDFDNLESVQVNYYLMDIELLFSRNPFVQGHSGHFSHVKPNVTQTLELPKDQKRITFELPDRLHNRNVLIEVVGRGKTQTAAYYSNSLALQTMDNYGRLRVTSQKQQTPLSGVYIKAYAKLKDGRVRFYKDGYTDLRGRFDYASLSTNELDNVERFSLLVLSDEHGAIVREVAPPTR